ncbi:MAG: ATP-binding protein [Rickettsia endosymbiont of Ixodes persulcatus]|nr:ATP-binding protein [Rickettsia endosymbiont of Ixodes persulcatus]
MQEVSNALFKTLLNSTKDAVIVLEKTDKIEIIYQSKAYIKLIEQTCRKKNSYQLNALLSLISASEGKSLLNIIEKVLSSNKITEIKIQLIFSDIPTKKWALKLSPVKIDLQPTKQIICTIENIVQSNIGNGEVLITTDKEERFKLFFDQAPLSMCVLTGEELITEYANDDILKLWGRTRKEIIGIPQEVSRPEFKTQKEIVKQIKDIFKTGKTLYIDELHVSTPVIKGYFNAIYQPLKNTKNEVTSILVIVKNITDQVYARNELIKAKDILKLAMDAAGMGSWNIDLTTKNIILSERTQQIYETDHYKLSINSAKAMIIDADLENVTKSIKKALHHKTSFNLEYQIQFGRPETKWMRAAGKAYYNEEGRAVYFAGTVLDISEQKKDEIRKNDFIGMVSHELKTPLTSLSAYIQLLQYKLKDKEDEFAKETLNKVVVQLKRLFVMIDGFLNVSLLDSGKIILNKTNFDLVELVQTVAEENRVILLSHFIQVIAPDQIIVNADRERIGSVINNLINNAAKYSKKESLVAIKCDVNESGILLSIEDEGIGISQMDLSKIFNRFYRVESIYTKTVAGFGVGLYICSEVINKHGGKIWVESEIGRGSTFYFSLPT